MLLEKDLPPAQQRQVRLAAAGMWVQQALAAHQRLLAAGLQPARQLDPLLQKALVRCYQLPAGLEDDDAFAMQVRQLRDSILQHYQRLEYFDTMEAAINVKADPAVDAMDAYAEFQMAGLRLLLARRELSQHLQQHQGRESIALTPSFKEAIAAYQKFITDRPTHRLSKSAVSQLFSIGQLFESHQAQQVAVEVYADLEKFAGGVAVLSSAQPGKASVAGRAAQAMASALHTHATRILAKSRQGLPADAPPPAQLSDEFKAAIAAYQGIVESYPDSPLVSAAIGKIMGIGLEYAQLDAWDVSNSVYASLAEQELPLRHPERLKLARALCQLGKVLPDHSRQVLTAITLWERMAPTGQEEALAQLAGSVGGGIGGMAGMGGFDRPRRPGMGMGDSAPAAEAAAQPGSSGPGPGGDAPVTAAARPPADPQSVPADGRADLERGPARSAVAGGRAATAIAAGRPDRQLAGRRDPL